MANPLKGEVDFAVEGKSLTLCFSTNSIVQVEHLLSSDITAISSVTSVENIRALLWGALQANHPDIDLKAAGGLLDDYDGGVMGAFEKIVRALRFRISRTPIDTPLDDSGA